MFYSLLKEWAAISDEDLGALQPMTVAYAAAESSGVDVVMAFLAVAYGASCAFILPFAHQCNLMVLGPGGYSTKDFVKVGTGLSIVMAVTAVVLLAL